MKSNIILLFTVLILASGFAAHKNSNTTADEKGVIKVTVLYPNGEGKTFDWDYYTNKHVPLLKTCFGKAMTDFKADKGVSSNTPNTPVPYVAIGYLYFENVEAYREVIKTRGTEIRADIAKYTNIIPVVQISEVVL